MPKYISIQQFKNNTIMDPKPWIIISNAETEKIVEQFKQCPSVA